MIVRTPAISGLLTLIGLFVGTCLALLVLPIAIVILIGVVFYGAGLTLCAWLIWFPTGIDTVVIYSDSPNWRDYMLLTVLPDLEQRSVLLNWSHRRNWSRFSLAVAVFHFFGGSREHTPCVIVLRPFRVPRIFRFFRPLRDHKHGNVVPLRELETQLHNYLGIDPDRAGK